MISIVLSNSNVISYLTNRISDIPSSKEKAFSLLKKNIAIGKIVIKEYSDGDIDSKNICFAVQVSTEIKRISFFLKQPKNSSKRSEYLSFKESVFYSYIEKEPTLAEIRNFLPKIHDFDQLNSILILEFIESSKDLSYYFKYGDEKMIPILNQIGKVLLNFHDAFRESILGKKSEILLFRNNVPSLLFTLNFDFSDIAEQHNDELAKYYAYFNKNRLGRAIINNAILFWNIKKDLTIVHGDFKLRNILITESKDQQINPFLIDWENASFGNEEWDIANFHFSFFLNYVTLNNWEEEVTQFEKYFAEFLKGYKTKVNHQIVYTYLCLKIFDYEISNDFPNHLYFSLFQEYAYNKLKDSKRKPHGKSY
jgi:thiamine kinase-like enzyme